MTPRPGRRAAIVGVAESDVGLTPQLTVLSQQALAAQAALREAGLAKDTVDAVFTAGAWSWAPTMTLAEYLGIQPRYTDSTNIGGSSFEAHAGHAAAAIEAGLIDVALITYGSTQRTSRSRNAPRPAELTAQFELPYGLPMPVGAYALAAMRHMHQYGTTSEDLAEVAVAARQWARLNPRAWYRDPITVEDVLASPMICDPLHKLDCCLVTDGGGAVVIAAEDRWPDVATRPVVILGHGETHTHAHDPQHAGPHRHRGRPDAGRPRMKMAGVTVDDIDVAEIYDSFTITVLLTLESLGFCKPGEAKDFVAGGRTAPGGEFPMNTNGGGLAYTHPGMYGIFLLIEAVRQLRGDFSWARQVPDAEIALVHGTGGVLSSAATVVLATI